MNIGNNHFLRRPKRSGFQSLPPLLASAPLLLLPILPLPAQSQSSQQHPAPVSSPQSPSLPSFGSILEYIEQQPSQQPFQQPRPVPVSSLPSSSFPGACEPRQDQRREPHIPSRSSSSDPSVSSILKYIDHQQDASASPPNLCPKHAKQLRKKQLLRQQEPSVPSRSVTGTCEPRQEQCPQTHPHPSPTSTLPSFASFFAAVEEKQKQLAQQPQQKPPVPSRSATGACEPRQEKRPQKPTPQPTGCGHRCAKVKKFLPAHFCGHEVPPHKMKDGNRVVRIDDARARRNVAIVRAEAHAKAAARAAAKAAKLASQRIPSPIPAPGPSTPKKIPFSLPPPPPLPHRNRYLPETPTPAPRRPLPPVKPVNFPPARVGHAGRTDEKRSEQCAGSSADYDIQGFRNPDLNDKPLHFSPSMFKPEIDRHNFTWSTWDSRSTEFSMHEWESPVAPPGALDKLGCKHPELLLRIRNAMAGLPPPRPDDCLKLSPVPAGSSIDSIHYGSVGDSSFFSSPTVVPPVRGRVSFATPLSSDWVLVDEEAWESHHAITINTMLARDWAGVEEGAEFRKYIRTLVQVGYADPPAESACVEARALRELRHHASHPSVHSSPSGKSTLSLLYGSDAPPSPTTSTLSRHQPASGHTPQHFRSLRQVPIAATIATTTAAAQPPPPPAVTTKKSSSFSWKSLSCIAVAATTVAAGLAYAWFSG
ncbi:hypothetical protein F5X99DRAFT_422789 [Biscogniauxia marginata]|nr:hypothetical protein F5X99DRAFT_422789 [Biscogniauxia marginata]